MQSYCRSRAVRIRRPRVLRSRWARVCRATSERVVNFRLMSGLGLSDLSQGRALFRRCYDCVCLRGRRHHLKAGDGPADIAFELLGPIRARNRHSVVAATRRALEKLEHAIRLRAATSSRTPVRMPTTEVSLGNRHIPIAEAYQLTPTVGAKRTRRLLFVHYFTDDLPRRTGSDAAIGGLCRAILAVRRVRVSRTCAAALI